MSRRSLLCKLVEVRWPRIPAAIVFPSVECVGSHLFSADGSFWELCGTDFVLVSNA